MTSPREVTLCYILQAGRVLLIRKKRGIGAGKVNAPGGKVDAGETALEAAVRETQEETAVTPLALALGGELLFRFPGGVTHRCLIFLAHDCIGDARETAEAAPWWCPVESLPYDEMWTDDRQWLPLLLAGRRFRGAVTISGEEVIEQHIEIIDEAN